MMRRERRLTASAPPPTTRGLGLATTRSSRRGPRRGRRRCDRPRWRSAVRPSGRGAGRTVVLLLLGALVLAPSLAGALPTPEPVLLELHEAVGERVAVEGTINRYGSEPSTFLGLLATADRELELVAGEPRIVEVDDELLFRLTGDLADELDRFQGRRAVVTGELVAAPQARGLPPVIRVASYELAAEEE